MKVRFTILAEATTSKTSVLVVQSLQIDGEDEIYLFPKEKHLLTSHTELAKLPAIKSAAKSIKSRGQFRRVLVTLSEDIKKMYFDDEGNPVYEDWFLEESMSKDVLPIPDKAEASEKKRSLQSITKDMVVEKFTDTKQNAGVWLRTFVAECDRLKIDENQRVETLRLFLGGSPSEWFQANWKLYGEDTWEDWSKKFLESFNEKGWSDLWYAINYKWLSGSLFSEYAIKKMNLLIDADSELTEKSRIGLIVIGLPISVQQKINRKTIDTFGKLLAELGQLANSSNKDSKIRNNNNNNNNKQNDAKGKPYLSNCDKNNRNSKFCPVCEKLGYQRTHAESECRNKWKLQKSEKDKEKNIRLANNTEMEDFFNQEITDQKNL